MNRFLASLGVLAAMITMAPVAGAQYYDVPTLTGITGGTGVHPWDARSRRSSTHINPYNYVSDYEYYYSAFRSVTFALHPYNRGHYYDSVSLTYDPRFGRTVLTRLDSGETTAPTCDNYSYQRPNYRVPPFGYTCY